MGRLVEAALAARMHPVATMLTPCCARLREPWRQRRWLRRLALPQDRAAEAPDDRLERQQHRVGHDVVPVGVTVSDSSSTMERALQPYSATDNNRRGSKANSPAHFCTSLDLLSCQNTLLLLGSLC